MQTIKVLDPQEAIKIAAGEVIERPAHIIKELIENSIDAQATAITIQLRAAGKEEIIITDNGIGMSPEDAKLCFAHHATSKISHVNDLTSIITYGFRGEALSSIASVSRVELKTKTDQEKTATHIILHNNVLEHDGLIAHQTGTTLSISHLFDNVPARKKFLKSDDTEWNQIVSIFQAFCLKQINIHFKLLHNDYVSYNCPPTCDIKTRCLQLWDANLGNQLLTVNAYNENNTSLHGAITAPHFYRFNRGQIFTFINNRWVKNVELLKGVLRGYDGVLPTQKYPAAFIFLTIDPTQIDINVHPKKEEVKFLHPTTVQKCVENAVKNTLNQFINKTLDTQQSTVQSEPMIPTAPTPSSHSRQNYDIKEVYNNPFDIIEQSPSIIHTIPKLDFQKNVTFDPAFQLEQPFEKSPIIQLKKEPLPHINISISTEETCTIIGQFHKTYIVIEKQQQLILIDQHAAHERILYERFRKQAQLHDTQTIQLLFPHIVKLNTSDASLILQHSTLFAEHGIVFEGFSDQEIIIQSTPIMMQAKAVEEIIQYTLVFIKDHQAEQQEKLFDLLHNKIITEKACKAACKAGDTLNQDQMKNLITELQTTDHRFCCPHGRPTLFNQNLKDIEKHFKRDYVGSKNLELEIF